MAHCPQAIKVLWDALAEGTVAVPSEVWRAWDEASDDLFREIRALLCVSQEQPLTAKDAEKVLVCIDALQKILCSVKRSVDRVSRLEGGVIYFHPVIKALLAHHLGNDLYKIALLADVSEADGEQITPEARAMMINNVDQAGSCIGKLKQLTCGTSR